MTIGKWTFADAKEVVPDFVPYSDGARDKYIYASGALDERQRWLALTTSADAEARAVALYDELLRRCLMLERDRDVVLGMFRAVLDAEENHKARLRAIEALTRMRPEVIRKDGLSYTVRLPVLLPEPDDDAYTTADDAEAHRRAIAWLKQATPEQGRELPTRAGLLNPDVRRRPSFTEAMVVGQATTRRGSAS